MAAQMHTSSTKSKLSILTLMRREDSVEQEEFEYWLEAARVAEAQAEADEAAACTSASEEGITTPEEPCCSSGPAMRFQGWRATLNPVHFRAGQPVVGHDGRRVLSAPPCPPLACNSGPMPHIPAGFCQAASRAAIDTPPIHGPFTQGPKIAAASSQAADAQLMSDVLASEEPRSSSEAFRIFAVTKPPADFQLMGDVLAPQEPKPAPQAFCIPAVPKPPADCQLMGDVPAPQEPEPSSQAVCIPAASKPPADCQLLGNVLASGEPKSSSLGSPISAASKLSGFDRDFGYCSSAQSMSEHPGYACSQSNDMTCEQHESISSSKGAGPVSFPIHSISSGSRGSLLSGTSECTGSTTDTTMPAALLLKPLQRDQLEQRKPKRSAGGIKRCMGHLLKLFCFRSSQ